MNNNNDEMILNFMQITQCDDHSKAQDYLAMANNNLEGAVSLFLELEGQISSTTQPSNNTRQIYTPEESKFDGEFKSQVQNSPPKLMNSSSQPLSNEHQQMIQQYKIFALQRQQSSDGIIVKVLKGSYGMITRIFSKQKDDGQEFLAHMSQRKINLQIQFARGNFQTNLDSSQHIVRPLLLYIHPQDSVRFESNILTNLQFFSFLNKMFHNVGFLLDSQAVAELREKGFNIDRNPCIMVFRKDLFDKAILMGSFEISPETESLQLIDKLKALKAQFNKQYILDEQIKQESSTADQALQQQQQNPQQQQFNQYNQNYQQNIYQSQQLNIQKEQQQLKLQQERELRAQQEKAYKQAEDENKKKIQNQKDEQLKQQQIKNDLERLQEEKLTNKAILISNIPDEPNEKDSDVIKFQFRMPNGNIIERRFKNDLVIQNLFDFVSCQNEEFFDNPDGNFNLIQNFPKLSLQEHKQQLISDIFQETQMEQLIINEL